MKILFYDTKKYDKESFDKVLPKYEDIEIEYVDSDISVRNAVYAKGFEAVCGFVSSDFSAKVIDVLADNGVKIILLRCAGFNNVDIKRAKERGVLVLRVPGYSPEAVAEHAMALALASNRHIHKGYIKVRENNFSLVGLTGLNFFKKTAGIIGTGKIGAAMCRICKGFGMRVIAYDIYQNPDLDFVEYVDLDTLLAESDLISLHCPLTEDLIKGIRQHKFHSVGLDVYEEETANVFENREDDIMETSITSRLLSFPNVIVTSHQAFLTEEALEAISYTTLENAQSYIEGHVIKQNLVLPRE